MIASEINATRNGRYILRSSLGPSRSLLRASWKVYGPEQLQLLLVVYHYVENNTLTENEYVTTIFGKEKPLLAATKVKLFSKAFKSSFSCYPRKHSLWYGRLAALTSQDEDKTSQSFTFFACGRCVDMHVN